MEIVILRPDALNRPVDQGGFNFWISLLHQGYTQSWVVEQFIAGQEFQNTRGSWFRRCSRQVTENGERPPRR